MNNVNDNYAESVMLQFFDLRNKVNKNKKKVKTLRLNIKKISAYAENMKSRNKELSKINKNLLENQFKNVIKLHDTWLIEKDELIKYYQSVIENLDSRYKFITNEYLKIKKDYYEQNNKIYFISDMLENVKII